jgi:hypothetical protein
LRQFAAPAAKIEHQIAGLVGQQAKQRRMLLRARPGRLFELEQQGFVPEFAQGFDQPAAKIRIEGNRALSHPADRQKHAQVKALAPGAPLRCGACEPALR